MISPPARNEIAGSNKLDGPKVNFVFRSNTLALVKLGYMLESLRIRRYSATSNKSSGADNQQETRIGCFTRLVGSSETIRQAEVPQSGTLEDIVRAAWRHAEAGRNDLLV
jgi:hypothetical protein